MQKQLNNKVIWITGASSGIGNAVLHRLLESGAIVIASSRKIDALQSLTTKYPQRLILISVDATDRESIYNCIDQISNRFNHIDIVILNAGNCVYFNAENFNVEILHKNFSLNYFGLALCIEASLKLLKKSVSPQIIGMTSAVAYLGLPTAEGYGAAKAAARYLLQCLQSSFKKDNISVSIICPGFVKTPLTDLNSFKMPFIISADKAANYIIRGIVNRQPEIAFPFRLVILFKLLNMLPSRLRIYLLSKLVSK